MTPARSGRHTMRCSGPLPAVARRLAWVAVRMDPALCPQAVRHRGGGWAGTVRTAATATRRSANRLSDAGLDNPDHDGR
ncbi:type VII secretion protein EccE [Mycobacterium tilburgii]|uniref:type VII secretion protein EccE n=1 Tax=Mycobacterium tilburgii TaxID=44467 RepID=UPI0028C3CFDA|nr:type VII secretion protein EccE [Mycobacterium tilburgii]